MISTSGHAAPPQPISPEEGRFCQSGQRRCPGDLKQMAKRKGDHKTPQDTPPDTPTDKQQHATSSRFKSGPGNLEHGMNSVSRWHCDTELESRIRISEVGIRIAMQCRTRISAFAAQCNTEPEDGTSSHTLSNFNCCSSSDSASKCSDNASCVPPLLR